MIKFQRNFRLQIQVTEGGEIIQVQDPLTCNFYISHRTMAAVNFGNFSIFNIGLAKRLRIQKDRWDDKTYRKIEFAAGYAGTYTNLFTGNITLAQSGRKGGQTENVTEIEAFDGGYAMVNSFTGGSNRTYGPNTEKKTIIRDLASDMQKCTIGAIGNFPGQCLRGRSLNGYTQDLLKQETNNHFFIHNQKIYCLNNAEVIDDGIFIISSKTGLLGSPRRQETLLLVDILFEPGLALGQIARLQSEVNPIYNGDYKVMGIEHRGVISKAQGGECLTTVSLWAGTEKFTVVGNG